MIQIVSELKQIIEQSGVGGSNSYHKDLQEFRLAQEFGIAKEDFGGYEIWSETLKEYQHF